MVKKCVGVNLGERILTAMPHTVSTFTTFINNEPLI